MKKFSKNFKVISFLKICFDFLLIINIECCRCYPYYTSNDNKEQEFGDFKLELGEEKGTSIFRIRTIKLTALDKEFVQNGEPDNRTIYHFQFTDWPDFGVPSETKSFLEFCRHVSDAEEKLREANIISPVVVSTLICDYYFINIC